MNKYRELWSDRINLERQVLSTIMNYSKARYAVKILRHVAFLDPFHETIFYAMVLLVKQDLPIDLVTMMGVTKNGPLKLDHRVLTDIMTVVSGMKGFPGHVERLCDSQLSPEAMEEYRLAVAEWRLQQESQ